jgi:uncharacterized membrane protein YkgB
LDFAVVDSRRCVRAIDVDLVSARELNRDVHSVRHHWFENFETAVVNMGTILVVILILLLIGAVPRWGYSSNWGYGPSGILGVILVVIIILLLLGKL